VGTQAVAFLNPRGDRADPYESLVASALDPGTGFDAKREAADEYGWRNFGDLPADHESAFLAPPKQFVSHYNNQYDAVAGFALHFLRDGDRRWWRLMDGLARHVRDIDIYHTTEDKPAYSGGMFWHTQHYMDAATATHRTYPHNSNGGGPSSEHNYNAGLMFHYFLTGDSDSRDAAIELGEWVLNMDDGARTPLRWLAPGPTGLASASGDAAYHGPGRGAANSILACLVAHRLSGDARYSRKAEELIRRSIHPRDDLAARNLLDAERRWYYTMFLQVLGVYLHGKREREEIDGMYAYARHSLLHYARWMLANERPYLERPEILEFPTETWAAQDLRKSDVLATAAAHATTAERSQFRAGAKRFFEYATTTLLATPKHRYTRPLVIVLTNGFQFNFSENQQDLQFPEGEETLPNEEWPRAFRPQKAQAARRLSQVGFALLASCLLAAYLWIS
jgi:hypothetical protein